MSDADPHLWRRNVAAILMDDEGNILLGGTPEKNTRWHFPQGGVKAGESDREAMLRELREEVGLHRCRILATYAGLRYEYRRKNKKSHRWLGQQQTYFLLHCPGVRPVADCSHSAEFSAVRWLPYTEIQAELFVPFKREVTMRAMAHFFPGGAPFSPLLSTIARYLHTPGQEPPQGTPLFAGKKSEALCHLSTLSPCRVKKSDRAFILLLGMEGAGLKKCLRRIAPSLDPLTTRYISDPRRYKAQPSELIPLPGELTILALPAEADECALLPPLTARLKAEGVRTLSIGLHISGAKQARRLAEKGKSPSAPYATALQTLHSALASAPGERYLLPSDQAWYRDYLLTLLLESFLTA